MVDIIQTYNHHFENIWFIHMVSRIYTLRECVPTNPSKLSSYQLLRVFKDMMAYFSLRK
jgi:hypothetical protein